MAGVRGQPRALRAALMTTLAVTVRGLTVLLALALLVVGTVAVIAELKGTWHWAIHLESTISYIGYFVTWLLALLVPGFLALVVSRRVITDA